MKPEDASRVQVLFVTLDPERDTPEMLQRYVPYFHPSFLGLYGSAEEVAAAAKEFHIAYRKHVEPGATDYLVDHTAGSYVLDKSGRLRLFLPFGQPPAEIAHDLKLLLVE
jgi:protein SCO1